LRETAAGRRCAKTAAAAFKTERHILASICAGVPTSRLEKPLPAGRERSRMPNTPMLVGLGASCLCAGKKCEQHGLDVIERFFRARRDVRVEER